MTGILTNISITSMVLQNSLFNSVCKKELKINLRLRCMKKEVVLF